MTDSAKKENIKDSAQGGAIDVVRVVSIGIAILFVAGLFFAREKSHNEYSEENASVEDIERKKKEEKEWREVAYTLYGIKQSLNNPNSFELVNAYLTDEDILCVVFRGTNAFGGIVTNRYVHNQIDGSVSTGSVAAWNKYCANRVGRDMTNQKYQPMLQNK